MAYILKVYFTNICVQSEKKLIGNSVSARQSSYPSVAKLAVCNTTTRTMLMTMTTIKAMVL